MNNNILLAAIMSFLSTLIATPIAIKFAPLIGAMDIPKDNRRVHTKPIPRFGGIAILCGFATVFILLRPLSNQLLGLLIGALIIFIIGLIDDLKDLNAKIKLFGQILCSIVVWFFDIRVVGISNYFGSGQFVFPEWITLILTIIWIVGITNTINLIDGLDGLASGIVFIACLAVSYTAYVNGQSITVLLSLAVAGATGAFLIFNFYPAKIFMGDAGSQLLGYLMAAIPLVGISPTKGTTLFATLVPIMILALPVFDTGFAIVRRVKAHKPIMQADKGHLHHRIMKLGFGQRRTVLALYSISAIMGIAGIVWTMGLLWEAAVLVGIAATLVLIFLGIGVVDRDVNQDTKSGDTDETKETIKEKTEVKEESSFEKKEENK